MADQQTRRSFLRQHPWLTAFFALFALLCLGIGAGIWFAATVDYRAFLENRLSALLDRPVKIGVVSIAWGDPLRIEARDIRLANIAGGSTADMATIEHIAASIDATALWHRQIILRNLRVDTPVITLERDASGRGNWLLADAEETPPGTQPPNAKVADEPRPTDVAPAGRGVFPTLFDFALTNGTVTYHTFSGHVLRIDLHDATIKTAGLDQAVEIAATGAYNGADMALHATTGSFNDLHDAAKPLDASIAITRQSAKVIFNGTLIDPLNVDGAAGALHAEAQKLNDILGVFHASFGAAPAATLDTHLTRQGDLWHFVEAKGDLGGNAFTGQLHLLEGRHGGSDDLKLEMNFDELALDKLLPNPDKEKTANIANWRSLPLEAPDKSAPRLTAVLSAAKAKYRTFDAIDVQLSGGLAPDAIALDQASLTLNGIPLQVSGVLKSASKGGRLTGSANLKEADFQSLVKALGGSTADLSGKITAGLDLTLQGKSLDDGLRNSRGGAVLSMSSGRISRDLLEKASTDLRNIFRKGEGTAKVNCLLAVLRLENGIGTISPARLRSNAGTLNAQGHINFLNESLDLTLQSDRSSTGFLALDMPVRLSGAWAEPKAELRGTGGIETGSDSLDDLSPSLQGIAAANTCRQ